MPKILKPYTIVPSNLYVHRDADRQVKHIINDMGRPGYVLVSRQMGKTNLLLNAKRELETENDAFVYIDLSNPFENAKACFENIINTALETNKDIFGSAEEQIIERRKLLSNTPAHKQHTNELRILLNSIKGKLVIILDEIDALTKTQYSDQIFSQIRSIYFLRVNYLELARLTYLLSGVIEPNDIIKDPKISPFNIGQKIFLNDFSKEEFYKFLVASKIDIDEKIKNRIYYWTNGNPRITWDICSEVENLLKDGPLSEEIIDKIVHDLYLTSFDKPPIDNIREIVKNDREIRNAIIEIEYAKGHAVSDKIKNKLYLSGIINYEENNVQIKNNIIRKCLNLEWIKILEEEEKNLFNTAIELIDKEKYSDAFDILEKYLETSTLEDEQKGAAYYYTGLAAFRISKFEKALKYLLESNLDKEDNAKLYYIKQNLLGLTHYYLNNIDESLKVFDEIIQRNKRDDNYIRALLNFGSISLKSDNEKSKINALNIFEEIINEKSFDISRIKQTVVDEIKTIAYYNKAQLLLSNNKVNLAVESLRKALEYADISKKPTVMLSLYDFSTTQDEKDNILNEIIELICTNDITPIYFDPERPIDYNVNNLKNVLIYSLINNNVKFFNKMKNKFSVLGAKNLSQHLYDLAIFALSSDGFENSIKILDHILENENNSEYELDKETKFNTLKLYLQISREEIDIGRWIDCADYLKSLTYYNLDLGDLGIYVQLIYRLTQVRRYNDALNYINYLNSIKKSLSAELIAEYLLIDHLELNLFVYTGQKDKSIIKAKEILKLIDMQNEKKLKRNFFDDSGLEIIKSNAEGVLNIKSKQLTTTQRKTYGRNDIVKVRYKDGTILETKFKKIENDLAKGECIILI